MYNSSRLLLISLDCNTIGNVYSAYKSLWVFENAPRKSRCELVLHKAIQLVSIMSPLWKAR